MTKLLENYCTTKEAADLLGIRLISVINLIKAGRLKGEKVGNSWLVFKPSIEEYYNNKAPSGHPATGTPKLATK